MSDGITFDDGPTLFEVEDVPPVSLTDRFVVPPLSILDTRQGYWQDRRRRWLELGMQSEVGRGGDLTFNLEVWDYDPEGRKDTSRMAADRRSNITGAPPLPDYADNGMANIAPGTSIFDPVMCEIAYRWFSREGATVLDPFAGGSVRGITASHLGRRYTGIELRPEQVDANYHQLEIAIDPYPEWIAGDAHDVHDLVGDAMYDLVFTCPPYADLEVYSDDPRDLSTMDYADFRASMNAIVHRTVAHLRDDRFAVIVVGDARDKKGRYYGFPAHTVNAFESAGLHLYNEMILSNAVGTAALRAPKQFEASRKTVKTHQNVYVFVKGSGRAAADWAKGEGDE